MSTEFYALKEPWRNVKIRFAESENGSMNDTELILTARDGTVEKVRTSPGIDYLSLLATFFDRDEVFARRVGMGAGKTALTLYRYPRGKDILLSEYHGLHELEDLLREIEYLDTNDHY